MEEPHLSSHPSLTISFYHNPSPLSPRCFIHIKRLARAIHAPVITQIPSIHNVATIVPVLAEEAGLTTPPPPYHREDHCMELSRALTA